MRKNGLDFAERCHLLKRQGKNTESSGDEGKAAEKKLLGMNNGNLQDSNREH